MTKHFQITPRKIAGFFTAIVLILLVANLCCLTLQHLGYTFHTMSIFHFNKEGNIPTVYSGIAIFFSAWLLWITGNLESERILKRTRYWRMLSLMLAFLAIDELVSIHESLTDDSTEMLGDYSGGFLHFAWIIPYTIIFGIVMVAMTRFLFRLPANTRRQFIIAGLIFVSGAVGLETIGGKYIFEQGIEGKTDLAYGLIITVEELLEMAGIIVFIHAIASYYLTHVERQSVKLILSFHPAERKIMETPRFPHASAPSPQTHLDAKPARHAPTSALQAETPES